MTHAQQNKKNAYPVYAVTPFTLLDFPNKTACIIWFSGCNMRCPYCHNPQIVKDKGRYTIQQILSFLYKRQGLLDGVVLSGGEATNFPALPALIKEIKNMGYAVKLDTNGLRPDVIAHLLKESNLDYIALDYKAPPDQFKKNTGTEKYNKFSSTLDILCAQNKVPFDIRTTVHTDLLNASDVNAIIHDLEQRRYSGTYTIQNFTINNKRPTLGAMKEQTHTLNQEILYKPSIFTIDFRNF